MLRAKDYEILMRGSGKKMHKTFIFGHLGQKGPFWKFLAKMAKMVKIIKKGLGTFFSHLQALTNCKVSEKSNERFPRKNVADERKNESTDVRTDATEVSTTSWSRDQKVGNN